jgi:hypothetical protein
VVPLSDEVRMVPLVPTETNDTLEVVVLSVLVVLAVLDVLSFLAQERIMRLNPVSSKTYSIFFILFS